jgi:hypothetical protein
MLDPFERLKPLSKKEKINAVLDAIIVNLCFLWLISIVIRFH